MPIPFTYNVPLDTDSYKPSHRLQYPDGTTVVESHSAPRNGKVFPYAVPFGVQSFLLNRWEGRAVTPEMVDETEELTRDHYLGARIFEREVFDRLVSKHDGRLPIEVRALPEGLVVPIGTPTNVIKNTDAEFFWLTNYLETPFLRPVWAASTVATKSRYCLEIIGRYLVKTGTPELLGSRLHDFGSRGVPTYETAAMLGCAHLVNSGGTDTLPALKWAKTFYGAQKCVGFSIAATEHSTITSWGEDGELDAFRHWLDIHPTGYIACVSDSYDLVRAVGEYWGTALKEYVMGRDGTLVVRPDSGNPREIVLETLEILWDKFGGTVNDKGYRVLDSHVRVIQGDGVNPDSIAEILAAMEAAGWSADNIAFGMGGALLQKMDRDTLGWALKCNRIFKGDEEMPVWKQPKTDMSKASKGGQISVHQLPDGTIVTRTVKVNYRGRGVSIQVFEGSTPRPDLQQAPLGPDLLRPVFRDGEMLVRETFDEIKDRAKIVLPELVAA